MSGWQELPLGEVCTIRSGSSNTQDADFEGEYVFFDRSKTPKRSNRFLFDCEAIIIAGEGAEFRPKKYRGKFDLHQRAYAIYGFGERILGDYLFYYLEHVHEYFQRVAVGATVKSLRQRHFEQLRVIFPSLEEQRRIVAVLDEAFAVIATATANAEKNLSNLEAWFEIELSSCFSGVSRQQPLGSIATLVRGPFGGSLKKEIFRPEGFAVYEQQHAINDQFDGVRYYVSEDKFREMKRFEVRSGELIMSCSGTIGRVALVPDEVQPGIINQALLKIAPSKFCLGEYLLWYMRSAVFRAKIADHSGGAALQNVASVAVLKTIEVPLPDSAGQKARVNRIHRLVQALDELTRLYETKLESLANLKKSLLHRAFSDQVVEREPLAA